METKKIAPGLALAAATLVALVGCSYPGSDADQARQQHKAAPSQSSTSTPAPAKDSPKSSATRAPKDAGDAKDKKDTNKTEKTKDKVTALNIDEVKGKRYSRANDFLGLLQASSVIGPYFESWFVDGNKFRYFHQNCAGQVKRDVSGTIKSGKLVWTGTDDHLDPWLGDQDTHTTPVEITATKFEPDPIQVDASTTDIAGQKKAFVGYCKKRGKQVGTVFEG